jgi:hypothetical protein
MTDTIIHADTAASVQRYLDFWNASPEDQLRLAPDTFIGEIRYTTPVGVLAGVEALVDFKRQLTEHLGQVGFVAREPAQCHHHLARLPWEVIQPDGSSFATGTDVIEFDQSGRIRAVSGFLDRAPEGFDHDGDRH